MWDIVIIVGEKACAGPACLPVLLSSPHLYTQADAPAAPPPPHASLHTCRRMRVTNIFQFARLGAAILSRLHA